MASLLHSLVLLFLTPSLSSWPPSGHVAPRLLFGPTANIPADIANQTLALLDTSSGLESWQELRGYVNASGGALHVRQQVLTAFMTSDHRVRFARAAAEAGVRLSMETGGSLCGQGSGTKAATSVLKKIHDFFEAGGVFEFLALESVFSRTHAGCRDQSVNTTAEELADYAAVMATALPNTQFFLYDALPHYSVGKFPANVATYNLHLEEVLVLLRDAMSRKGLHLGGYWMDCPYEYSSGAVSPLPSGFDGFEKIAEAVRIVKTMGLLVGKTFNSQLGGASSDQAFYKSTLLDFEKTTALVPGPLSGGRSFDHIMVETWYPHPLNAAPEVTPYTTAYTARSVFQQVRQSVVV